MAGPFGDAFMGLVGVALGIYVLYLLYTLIHRAFRAVGFTTQQASLIILGTFLGGAINIPFAMVNGWVLAINVGGAVIPVVISWMLLRGRPHLVQEALVGVTLTSMATFLVTSATPGGIVSPFPLWLLPALVAAAVSAVAFWQDRDDAAPLAYVSGTLGALIGADVFRMGEFLAQTPPEEGLAFASIGGAAVFDMVFLTGILAVGLDLLFFRQRRREAAAGPQPYNEGLVFTARTPTDVIRAYAPATDPALRHRLQHPQEAAVAPDARDLFTEWQERARELQTRR